MGTVHGDGGRLREVRRASGLSYAAFAAELGISKSSVSRYESGLYPLPRKVALALRGLEAQLGVS